VNIFIFMKEKPALKTMTDTLQTADGLTLHTQGWLPDADPKAVVLLVHGIAEHIGRYTHVAAFLVERGCAVYGLDHRTHGRSQGEPRVYIPDFDRAVNDLKQFFDRVKAAHPGKKIFVYGHSMGSFLATSFAVRYQDEMAGLISSGSPVRVEDTIAPLVIRVGSLLNAVAPRLKLIKLDLNAISRDAAVVAAYNADPLVVNQPVRVGMAVGYQQAVGRLSQDLPRLRLPLLLLHGGADRIAPPSGSEQVYREAQSADKTLKIYPGLYHEIHNEPEQAEVLADVAAWLDARV
jgi:lysophospholipase